jgi:glycosyltransferase involved in cell wall biosynthesis
VRSLNTHPELGQAVDLVAGRVSDEYLESIYADSTVLIAASEGEGFGSAHYRSGPARLAHCVA